MFSKFIVYIQAEMRGVMCGGRGGVAMHCGALKSVGEGRGG